MNPSTPEAPWLSVEAIDGAPGGLFVARVMLPDGTKVYVTLNRKTVEPERFQMSMQAVAKIWPVYKKGPI